MNHYLADTSLLTDAFSWKMIFEFWNLKNYKFCHWFLLILHLTCIAHGAFELTLSLVTLARIKKILSAIAGVWFSVRNYVVNLFDQFENNEGQLIAK